MCTAVCKTCNQELSLDHFFKDKASNTGYRSKCKKCTKEGLTIRGLHAKEYGKKLIEYQGEDYELIGDYNKDKVKILHHKCGKIREVNPSSGLRRGCKLFRMGKRRTFY